MPQRHAVVSTLAAVVVALAGSPLIASPVAAAPGDPLAFAEGYLVDFDAGSPRLVDLDGDGDLDLIGTNFDGDPDDEVEVALGLGDGTFTPPQLYPVGQGAGDLAVADLTGDGVPDAVTANRNDTVSVLVGDGGGGFEPPDDTATAGDPVAVALADVDLDGRLDVAVAAAAFGSGLGVVQVLYGDGDGGLSAPVTVATAPSEDEYPEHVAVADVDLDGRPDLAVTGLARDSFSILRNTVAGFVRAGDYLAGDRIEQLVPTDVDGDGATDLVVSDRAAVPADVGLFLGDGVGGFEARRGVELGPTVTEVLAADLDGDSLIDLAGLAPPGLVRVVQGDGAGGFGPYREFVVPGPDPGTFTSGDVDGDGLVDIAAVTSERNGRVLLNISDQPLLAVGDVTVIEGDGTATASFTVLRTGDTSGSSRVQVSTVDGNATAPADYGAVSRTVNFPPGQTVRRVSVTVVGDDEPEADETFTLRLTDVVGAEITDDEGVATIVDDDEFLPTVDFGPPDVLSDFRVTATAIADLDEDGRPDLIGASEERGVLVALGRYAEQTAPTVAYPPAGMDTLAAADLDGDGDIDVVSADSDRDAVHVLFGDGTGRLGTAQAYDAGDSPYDVEVGDLDLDGRPDLVVANRLAVRVLRGDGNGGFRNGERIVAGSPRDILVTDLDGDGASDLVLSGLTEGAVTVLLHGDEPRELEPAVDYPLSEGSVQAEAGDVNADGVPDLVVVMGRRSGSGASAATLLGVGDGTFASREFVVGGFPDHLGLGDVTGDGVLDAAFSTTIGGLRVLPGDGVGGFGPEFFFDDFGSGLTYDLQLADLTLDGRPDVLLGGVPSERYVNATGIPVQFHVADVSTPEGDGDTGTVTFTVTREVIGDTDTGGSVRFGTVRGTAVPPGDYRSRSGTLTFAPGEYSRSVEVAVVADDVPEADERLSLVLSGAQGGVVINGVADAVLIDDDSPATASIEDDLAPEGTSCLVYVELSSAYPERTTVRYRTRDGTAAAGSDYVAESGTVTFEAGNTRELVGAVSVEDSVEEPDEFFEIVLYDPVGGIGIGDGVGQCTVLDDD